MAEIEKAFVAVADDFVNSAETEEQLSLFIMIAVAAWNVSVRAGKEREDFMRVFIERFNCPSFTWRGKTIQTREKILELCDRKLEVYPDLKRLITSLDVEDCEDGLKYSVTSKAVEPRS